MVDGVRHVQRMVDAELHQCAPPRTRGSVYRLLCSR